MKHNFVYMQISCPNPQVIPRAIIIAKNNLSLEAAKAYPFQYEVYIMA
jgi:hypothetical protein